MRLSASVAEQKAMRESAKLQPSTQMRENCGGLRFQEASCIQMYGQSETSELSRGDARCLSVVGVSGPGNA
jgi:hypothetical protein